MARNDASSDAAKASSDFSPMNDDQPAAVEGEGPHRNSAIWAIRRTGETYAAIAARFGLSIARVARICERQAELERAAVAEAAADVIIDRHMRRGR